MNDNEYGIPDEYENEDAQYTDITPEPERKKLSERDKALDEVARDIIDFAINTCSVHLRFLGMVVNQLKPLRYDEKEFATEGTHFCYNQQSVVDIYAYEPKEFARRFLHSVMHCVFMHNYNNIPEEFRAHWDLATDIVAEEAINDLNEESFNSMKRKGQADFVRELKRRVGTFTAEHIYRHLISEGYSKDKMSQLRSLFFADSHKLWYLPAEEVAKTLGLPQSNKEKRQMEWEDLSHKLCTDMKTFSRGMGTEGGTFMMNLGYVNREKYDYADFLKKFAVRNESIKINQEEFDYIPYAYGMEHYGNIPLIEPLEYREDKKIRDFVIAIDTSGSVYGELVKKFLTKTYNILKSTDSFASKVNIHIVQCDTRIQHIHKLTSLDQLDDYIKELNLYGFGGTDFRPVFHYVDSLIESGELKNLKGMIYFTDGQGTYPSRKPDYETAFVFVENEYNDYRVPAWAIKLILEDKDFCDW